MGLTSQSILEEMLSTDVGNENYRTTVNQFGTLKTTIWLIIRLIDCRTIPCRLLDGE